MTEEKLKEIGLSDEQVKAVKAIFDGNYIPKERFDEINESYKALKGDIANRDKQLGELKGLGADNDDLRAKIEEITAQNKANAKEYEAKIAELKMDNAITQAITSAGGKNAVAIKSLLNLADIKLNDKGEYEGIEAQLNSLKTKEGYLFETQKEKDVRGLEIGQSANGAGDTAEPDFSKMTYSQMQQYAQANPGTKFE